jgi:hypothetical protein
MDKGVAVALGPRDEILKKLAQGATNDASRKEPTQANAVKGPDPPDFCHFCLYLIGLNN